MTDNMAIATPEVHSEEDQETKNKNKKQPLWHIIVHNDNDHTFHYVTLVISKVCGRTLDESYKLASKVHAQGRASVWQGTKEVAELKLSQIKNYGSDAFASKPVNYPLRATMEALPTD